MGYFHPNPAYCLMALPPMTKMSHGCAGLVCWYNGTRNPDNDGLDSRLRGNDMSVEIASIFKGSIFVTMTEEG